MSMELGNKIRIDVTCDDKPLLWNEEDVNFVKKNYRIVGREIGSLPFTMNSIAFGLPFTLMKEEAKLLTEKGFAELVEYSVLKEEPSNEIIKKNQEVYEQLTQKLKDWWIEKDIEKVEEKAEEILRLRLEKQGPSNLTLESVKAEEIRKLMKKDREDITKIYMEHPFLKDLPFKNVDWSYPSTDEEKLKYAIFKDIWEKGHYVTCGVKFGGDYLVYGDDPQLYHASFIIKCLDDEKPINSYDHAVWVRLATSAQKTLVMCSVDENGTVQYTSSQWPGKALDTLF